jgi:hypothetical protein
VIRSSHYRHNGGSTRVRDAHKKEHFQKRGKIAIFALQYSVTRAEWYPLITVIPETRFPHLLPTTLLGGGIRSALLTIWLNDTVKFSEASVIVSIVDIAISFTNSAISIR